MTTTLPKRFSLFLAAALVSWSVRAASPQEEAAAALIRRTVGEKMAAKVHVHIRKSDGNPSYLFSAGNGELSIEASSPVATARAFYDYLRRNGMGQFDWDGPHFRIPQKWPDAPPTRRTSPFRFNQMYNVVTAGYSFPYWTWERWERELDWLALHGYNMFMDPVATEAIANRVWLKLGLSQAEIDAFTCGPAHAPWHRMGNICGVDGPLPPEWNRDQIELQHKILKRARELGIEPIFQGFAGFVPHAMKKHFPNETYYHTLWNNGFKEEYRPIYLMPDSPLFRKITDLYLSEWKKEFGEGTYFLIDTFNEIRKFPVPEGATFAEAMRRYGKQLSDLLEEADPNVVWVLQGWIFHYQRKIWTPETVKALFSEVPDDKLLVLDMMGSWRKYDGFYGKPWIDGFIPNMGGKTPYTGSMQGYIREVNGLLASKRKGNNVGLSNHAEGIENQAVLFELIADLGWNPDIDLDDWLDDFCRNRYGKRSAKMLRVWIKLKNACYTRQNWHNHFAWQNLATRPKRFFPPEFLSAVKQFLALRNEFGDSPLYRNDALEMASLVLGQEAETHFCKALEQLEAGRKKAAEAHLARARKLLLAADRLLASHSLNRLDRWLGFARAHAANNPKLAAYYTENAKRILTSWGPPVNDYAARVWSGLIRGFYVPRMEAFFEARKSGRPFDQNRWEEAWLHDESSPAPISPYPHPLETAARLVNAIRWND